MPYHAYWLDAVLHLGRSVASTARLLVLALILLFLISPLCASATASAQLLPEELLIRGLSWDLQLEGGAGFGLDARLQDTFLGRVRAGALLADEPLIYNLGLTGELGGLASRGVGAELEVNHFGGPWLRAGLAYVRGDDWMTRASIGFAIFSLEWQHRLARWEPSDALIFQVRAPIGIFFFLSRKLKAQKSVPAGDKSVPESPVKSSAPAGPARKVLPVPDESARGRKPILRDESGTVVGDKATTSEGSESHEKTCAQIGTRQLELPQR